MAIRNTPFGLILKKIYGVGEGVSPFAKQDEALPTGGIKGDFNMERLGIYKISPGPSFSKRGNQSIQRLCSASLLLPFYSHKFCGGAINAILELPA